MQHTLRDLRLALRSVRKAPTLSLAVVLTLGFAIGGTTTVFVWADNVLWNPFPAVRDGGQLVALNPTGPDGRVSGMPPIAYPVYEEWRRSLTSFSNIAAQSVTRMYLRADTVQAAEPIWVQLVSPNFFGTAALTAAAGRMFSAADDRDRLSVCVISDRFLRRHFSGSVSALGATLTVNGVTLTVIGVTPPAFNGVISGLAFDMWVPVWLQPQLLPAQGDWMRDRSAARLQAFGRLRPGVSVDTAQRELAAVAGRASAEAGERPRTSGAVRYVTDTQFGSLLGPLSVALFGVTALVLLTAATNVAGLLAARAISRERDTAVQLALGASRWQVLRPLLGFSAVLALGGAATGIGIAATFRNALGALTPPVSLPAHIEFRVTPGAILFSASLAAVAAVAVTLLAAWRTTRPTAMETVRSAGTRATRASGRLESGLVVGQFACAAAALATAGLFAQSLRQMASVPLGFADPSRVLLASTDLTVTRLSGASTTELAARLSERLRTLPGVEATGLSTMVPLGFGGHVFASTHVDGYVPDREESMAVERAIVSAGYFDTMQIGIVAGRGFDNRDRLDTQSAVIVNRAFVERYLRGQEPIGRRIAQGTEEGMIVGVAANSSIRDLGEATPPVAYHPLTQHVEQSNITIHLRTKADPAPIRPLLRQALAEVHPELPVGDIRTLAEHITAATFVQYIAATVLGGFGSAALMIAALGLYAASMQRVARQRRDSAIRLALGARPAVIARAIVGGAARIAVAGVGIGMLLAIGGGRIAAAEVLGVPGPDPAVLIAAGAITLAVGIAAVVPAAIRSAYDNPALLLADA